MKRTLFAALAGALLLGWNGMAHAQNMRRDILPVQKTETPPPQVVDGPVVPAPFVTNGNYQDNRRGGFQIGAGIYYLKPFGANPAFSNISQSIVVNGAAVNVTTNTNNSDFDQSYSFTPRLWAGYEGECGLGVRLGWWRLDTSASASATVTPQVPGNPLVGVGAPGLPTVINAGLAAGQAANFLLDNRIEMNVFDLDVTQRLLDNHRWNLVVGAGIRYLTLDQFYNGSLNVTGLPAGVVVRNTVATRSDIDAIGPNFLLEADRRVGNRGFGLYASGRFGVLFSNSRQESVSNTFQAAGAASVNVTSTTVTDRNDVLPFLDVETGVQWQGCGRLRPFARIGITGQNYFGVGNANGGTNNFGLFGGTIMTGINW